MTAISFTNAVTVISIECEWVQTGEPLTRTQKIVKDYRSSYKNDIYFYFHHQTN
jgi:hypothetical protein